MGRLGGGEILLILLIALLLFGPSKLADMGRGLGEGLRNFKKGISDDKDEAPKPQRPQLEPQLPQLLDVKAEPVEKPVADVAKT